MGSAAYAPERDALVWKIKSFPGNKVRMVQSSYAFFTFHLVYDYLRTPTQHIFFYYVCKCNRIGVYVEG